MQPDGQLKLVDSDGESLPADDEEPKPESTPPPLVPRPSGLDSPVPTPAALLQDEPNLPTKVEGRETRNIRRRVEALEWEDGKGPGASAITHADLRGDTDVVDASENPVESESKDVELADVAAEVAETAQVLDQSLDKDAEIADVAAEVAETATELALTEEKDMEVAEVAAEVAESAKLIEKVDEKDVVFVDAPAPVPTAVSEPIVDVKIAYSPIVAPSVAVNVRALLPLSVTRLLTSSSI